MASLFFAINDELGQRVEVNRRDLRVDETPLTLDMVRLLLDRGASCCAADFVFPSHDRFETTFEECHWQQLPKMLSREMFQRWAADSLYELMGRLPLHCCLSFATDESLTNEDLWRIYLANMDIIEEERFDDPMLECIFRPTGQLQY
ncbi:hypothetical protein TKK_0005685 [Trichogramma kaykai]